MARPGLMKHRKFIRLERLLRNKAMAYGVLGLLWESAYESGEDVVGDADDVEAVCDWNGDRGALVSALQSCGGSSGPGFIRKAEDGSFVIHDFWDHAPSYVRRRADRECAREKLGKSLSQVRSEAGKRGAAAKKARRFGQLSENASAENHSEQEANGKQLASTTSTQHPTTRQAGFASPPPLSVVQADGREGESFEQQDTPIFTNHSLSPSLPPKGRELEERELSARERLFLQLWNGARDQRGRDDETLAENHRPWLEALLVEAERRAEKNSLRVEDVLLWYAVEVLDRSKLTYPTLRSALSPKVRERHLEEAVAALVYDRARPRRL